MPKIPLHKHLPQGELSSPIRVIELNKRKGYDSEVPHRHGYYEIFFFKESGGKHTIDFEEIAITSNSIHAVSPGQVHTLNREGNGVFIIFSDEVFENNPITSKNLIEYPFLNNNGFVKHLELNDDEFENIVDIISKVKLTTENKEVNRKWLELLLIYIKDAYFKKHSDSDAFIKSSIFREFKLLLERNYHEYHLPSWYSEKLNISINKLNEHIKKHTGETAGAFINNRICLESKRLLMYGDFSIKEISFDLGFSDPSYFSRFVKQNTGKSPKEWQKS